MIIGICGFQSSGKDTIADYLVKEYGFKRLSFASAIKDILSILFGWSRDKLEGLTKEDREWREQVDPIWSKSFDMPLFSPRYAMQYFATDLFRYHFHPHIWVKIIENQLDKYENIVISDCRFNNEIIMLQEHGGIIIQVHRNMPDWFYKYEQTNITEELNKIEELKTLHISEYQWIKCHKDYIIRNDSSVKDLYINVDDFLSKLLYKQIEDFIN